MNRTDQSAEIASAASAASLAGKTSLGGGAAMVVGGMTVSEWAMAGGFIVGVLGFIVQWYYRHREYKLKEQEHLARMGLYE